MSSRKLENAHLSTCLGRQVVGSGLGLQRRRNLNSLCCRSSMDKSRDDGRVMRWINKK